jgi:hypothetical protein
MILGRPADRAAMPTSLIELPVFTQLERARLVELRRAVRSGKRNDYGAGWPDVLFLRWLYRHRPNLRG